MTFMWLISEADVDSLVEPAAAIDAAERAFRLQVSGGLSAPGRLDLRRERPKAGMLVLGGFSMGGRAIVKSNMHAYTGDPPSRQIGSLLAMWDMEQSRPIALISSGAFNGHRTASGFAAAARVLAPAGATVLAVFGTGHLALPTVRYLAGLRAIAEVIVVGRRPEQAQLFAERVRQIDGLAHIDIVAESDPARAAARADIIATTTTADQPLFPGAVVRPGTLVILGGANRPVAREADDALIRRSRVYLDHRVGCLEKAGDIIIPFASGALTETQIVGEIGTFLTPGAVRPEADVTVFKSIGIAAQDMMLADHVLARAEATGIGTQFDPHGGAVRVAP
jgi:ornithine cyclodeaminase/alanine dehydrogenase-like protein (mu-crystallin family)